MPAEAVSTPGDIDRYLASHEQKALLRFITCGSVDDGKSTLIGRLLFESKLIFEDQLATLEADSAKVGTQGGELDLALLVDGLQAEREQGITIDVAYRFFSTALRKFIVADTPGHEQYTRNMVTGASTADAAIILVDARHGIRTQTYRHSYIVSLLGIRRLLVAINKLDLVGYSPERFEAIAEDYSAFAASLGMREVVCVPLSALRGDNVLERSSETPWYQGPTLMEWLDTVEIESERTDADFRLPVQWVCRPNLDFRGFAGTVVSGTVRPGDAIRVLPSGRTSAVREVLLPSGPAVSAVAEQAVVVTLDEEIDVSRGDVIAAATAAPTIADQFQADVVWMSDAPLRPGYHYLLKLGPRQVGARLSKPDHRIDVNTLEHAAAKTLSLNEIGVCTVTLDQPIPFDPYAHSRDMGGFILIDRLTNDTVAAGMLRFELRRSQNVHWQTVAVDKGARAALHTHQPAIVWFTGLSGAGKSTIANLTETRLHARGVSTYLLDGDNVRHGLNKDLGFTEADRIENIRRVAEVARLMVDAGLLVLVSFISPFREERALARSLVEDTEFCEVFIDTPLEVAEARDTKGLYRKARAGELNNFTGIDSPYEPPDSPELRIDTTSTDPASAADAVIDCLKSMTVLDKSHH